MQQNKNNYKQNYAVFNMNKRGQVTIFIIVAIAIIGLIAFLVLFRGGPTLLQGATISPDSYLKGCIDSDLRNTANLLAKNGGYENPLASVMYMGDNYTYLCYSAQYFSLCTVQQPFIKNNFERELTRIMQPKAEQCAQNLIDAYKSRGYDVTSAKTPEANASAIPKQINLDFYMDLTIKKNGAVQRIQKVTAGIDSNLYDLMFLAGSIIDYESTFGDSETTAYMQYYPDLRIDKIKRDDGSKIYILTDVVTRDVFKFASRSMAYPAGYGV